MTDESGKPHVSGALSKVPGPRRILRRLRLFYRQNVDRAKVALESLRREYLRRRRVQQGMPEVGSQCRDSVTIARIIGNDLYPRHADGASLKNLAFILEHEPDFPGCRKLFVINRIFDADQERTMVDLVERHGHSALVLPFRDEEYATLRCREDFFDGTPYPPLGAGEMELLNGEIQLRLWASAPKINYAMNVNGARNAAIEDGRSHSAWTVLLDGACFVSPQAWSQLHADLFSKPQSAYVIIPMTRLPSNDLALSLAPEPNRAEEPHIAFHQMSTERFDERFPYGLRDKTSLLDRLGVPGRWRYWRQRAQFPSYPSPSQEQDHYKFARTSVFRLSSGTQGGRLETPAAQRDRYISRNQAIFQTLALLDRRVGND